MKNFETPSINEIFKEKRGEYIPEAGEQLKKENNAEVEINGEKLNIDYREISIKELEKIDSKSVVLLPGFGSGWEGISELGFSLACERRKVIMLSLPGYGNSDNPSKNYFETGDFKNESEAVNQLLGKIGKEAEKFHLVGHSMASEILATLAEKHPEKVASLVLLNPAGVEEKENPVKLGTKFILSGIRTVGEFAVKNAFSGERDYENELKKYIPKTKSPFSGDRLNQRLAEAKKVAEGHLLEKLKKINVPITFISGELDSVYPPGKENDPYSQLTRVIEAVNDKAKIEKSVIAGLQHNTTIAPDEITAANIEHYLEKAEKSNQ